MFCFIYYITNILNKPRKMDQQREEQLLLLLSDAHIIITKKEMIELFCLRDIRMGLDKQEQIKWALEKLSSCIQYDSYYKLINDKERRLQYEMRYTKYIDTDCLEEFYNDCTLQELYYLGY